MSNEIRLFKTVARIINKFLPGMLEENRVTLAYLITGIIGSRNVQLRKIAGKVVYPDKETSLVERFRRFLRNENIVIKAGFTPFVELILSGLSQNQLVFVIDSSKVGGRCICLMVSVVYKSRALPVCWVVFKGRKGHSSAEIQLALLKTLQSLLPADRKVIILGDGEFDGSEVIAWLKQQTEWRFVCRSANSTTVKYQEEWFSLSELALDTGEEAFLKDILFTQCGQVASLNVLAIWKADRKEHWFFVTNFDNPQEAKKWYRKRFTIETLFSDTQIREGKGLRPDRVKNDIKTVLTQ